MQIRNGQKRIELVWIAIQIESYEYWKVEPAAKNTMSSSCFRRPTCPTICPFRPIGRWCACT
jgi:hypothetical protein